MKNFSLDDLPTSPNFKLTIEGRSTLDGRLATTLRIRPTLIRDIEAVASGPLYLLIDIALRELINKLNETQGSKRVKASDLNPTNEDVQILKDSSRTPKRRSEYLNSAKERTKNIAE